MATAREHDLQLERQQLTLLEALRRRGGEAVTYAELQSGGVEFPASVVSELELAGVPIERCLIGRGAEPAVGVRLDAGWWEPDEEPDAVAWSARLAAHARWTWTWRLLTAARALGLVLAALAGAAARAAAHGMRAATQRGGPAALRARDRWLLAATELGRAARLGGRRAAPSLVRALARTRIAAEGPRPRLPPAPPGPPRTRARLDRRRTLALAGLLAAGIVTGVVAALALQGAGPGPRRLARAGASHAARPSASAPSGSVAAASSSQPPPVATPSAATTTSVPTTTATTTGPASSAPSTPATTSTTAAAPPAPPTPVSATLAAQLQAHGHELLEGGRSGAAAPVLARAIAATGERLEDCVQPVGEACLTYAYALYDLGRALLTNGHPSAAVPLLERRLQIDNQRATVLAALQQARAQAGRI